MNHRNMVYECDATFFFNRFLDEFRQTPEMVLLKPG